MDPARTPEWDILHERQVAVLREQLETVTRERTENREMFEWESLAHDTSRRAANSALVEAEATIVTLRAQLMDAERERQADIARLQLLLANLATHVKDVLQPEFKAARAEVIESGNQSLHTMITEAVRAIRDQQQAILDQVLAIVDQAPAYITDLQGIARRPIREQIAALRAGGDTRG